MPNIYNLFKFLEKKKGTETPLKFKLIYAPEEVTDEDLNVEGDLDLPYTNITSLPDNLKVRGFLDLTNTKKITSLPDNLQVGGHIFLNSSNLTSLPDNLKVGDSLYLENTRIKSLPDNLQVGGHIFSNSSNLTSLPDNLQVGGHIFSNSSNLTSLPDNLSIGGDFWLQKTPLAGKYTKEEIRKMIEGKGGYVKGRIYV